MSPQTLMTAGGIVTFSLGAGWLLQKSGWSRKKISWLVIIGATLLVAILNAAFSLWHHQYFQTNGYDLGIFDQALWHASRFEAPASTLRGVSNLFGDHFHPIILTLVPFYWLFHSSIVLLVAQAMLFALIIPASFLLAKALRIDDWPALIFGLAFALNPGLTVALGFNFHEVAFAAPLIMLTFFFVERRQWRWFAVCMLALMLTKESLPIFTALIGLTLLLRRFYRAGVATIAASILAFVLITQIFIPLASDFRQWQFWEQYKQLAATPEQLPLELLKHPDRFVQAFFDYPVKVETMKWSFAAFGFLPLFSWTTLPLVIATQAERFWSDNASLWQFAFHYQVIVVAVLAVASLYTVQLVQRAKRWPFLPLSLAVFTVIMTVWVQIKLPALDILHDPKIRAYPRAMWQEALRRIPPDAAVTAQGPFAAHLAQRQKIYLFPHLRDAEYLIVDERVSTWPINTEEHRLLVGQIKNDPNWTIVQYNETFFVFQRVSAD